MGTKVKNIRIVDTLIVAQQRRLRCKVVSGDAHSEGVKDTLFLSLQVRREIEIFSSPEHQDNSTSSIYRLGFNPLYC